MRNAFILAKSSSIATNIHHVVVLEVACVGPPRAPGQPAPPPQLVVPATDCRRGGSSVAAALLPPPPGELLGPVAGVAGADPVEIMRSISLVKLLNSSARKHPSSSSLDLHAVHTNVHLTYTHIPDFYFCSNKPF